MANVRADNNLEKPSMFKKYPVGCDEDKEKIFCFPFILHKETISYIENYAHLMFIIRGPPSTGKATLSEMLTDRYPDAVYCCADRYFTDSFSRARRTRESIVESHAYCERKVDNACKNNARTIIVQNTHMRKWEMQKYLDLANLHNYTIVMAITLYRFDCTPKALAENNTDGLDISYFRNRLRQWEDIMPLFTGWFISPVDSLHLLNYTIQAAEALLSDGKFCRILDVYDIGDIRRYFEPRKVLYCLAGFSKNPYFMKKYYLSDVVQASYGKRFTISIVGYFVASTGIFAIVNVIDDMTDLLLKQKKNIDDFNSSMSDMFHSLNIQTNPLDNNSTTFPKTEELSSETTLYFEKQDKFEEIKSANCCFIDLARKDSSRFDIESLQAEFDLMLSPISSNGYLNLDRSSELGGDNDCKIYRLPNDIWMILPSQQICLQSIFTGFYS